MSKSDTFHGDICRSSTGRREPKKKKVYIIYHVRPGLGPLLSVYNPTLTTSLKLWPTIRPVKAPKVNVSSVDAFSALKCISLNVVIAERTFRKAPQKPPSSVHVYGINPSTVKVVWRYVQPSLEEEPLKGYKVRCDEWCGS
jgi:hypothetical protein